MLWRMVLRSSSLAARAAPLRHSGGSFGAAISYGASLLSSRGFLDIHKIGNREAIEKEKARLADELNRGYFADIKEFNKHGGKIAMANKTLIPSVMAVMFPDLVVYLSKAGKLKLPITSQNVEDRSIPPVTLLCLSFRASSQAMTESWTGPFLDAVSAKKEVQIYEVSFIDSWFLSLTPIKQLMLRILKKSSHPRAQIVYSFGDHYDFRKKLSILNLLTGYAFLVDRFGRIRWQGFGLATKEEISSLLSCTSLLLDEK